MIQVTAVRLPNGKIQVIKSNSGHVNEIFESEGQFYSVFQSINEAGNPAPSIQILDTING